MAQSRPTTTTDGAKALAKTITDLRERVRTLELREDPPSSGGGSSPVYMMLESDDWLDSLFAGGGFDFPNLGDSSYITAQSGDFDVVTHPGESYLSILLPEPGFYRFIWYWSFRTTDGYTRHGAIDHPYFWEIQTRLDTSSVDVHRVATELRTMLYTQGDGTSFQGTMQGVVEATSTRIYLTPLMHRYAAYPQTWDLPTVTDFYTFDPLDSSGSHGVAIEQIVAT